MFSSVYFILCEACCNCLQLKIYRVELGCGSIKAKTLTSFWAVKHKTKLLKFTELHFSFIAAQMLCKLLRGMKQNGMYSEIFGVCFCLDRNFQLGCCQNKADRITGVGHLLDI